MVFSLRGKQSMKDRRLTNAKMCEIVTLRTGNREKEARIKELEKYLLRATNELEIVTSQYGDNGSKHLIDRVREVLNGQRSDG